MHGFDSWALTLVVFVPAIGAAIVMLIPREQEKAIKQVALLTTLATLGFTIATLFRFDYAKTSKLQFSVTKDWPRWSVSHCPISRAVMSTPPPAANPATIFTGRVG